MTAWQTHVIVRALIRLCRFEANHAGPVMDFFSFLHFFKHTLCNNFKQAVGPGTVFYRSSALVL